MLHNKIDIIVFDNFIIDMKNTALQDFSLKHNKELQNKQTNFVMNKETKIAVRVRVS